MAWHICSLFSVFFPACFLARLFSVFLARRPDFKAKDCNICPERLPKELPKRAWNKKKRFSRHLDFERPYSVLAWFSSLGDARGSRHSIKKASENRAPEKNDPGKAIYHFVAESSKSWSPEGCFGVSFGNPFLGKKSLKTHLAAKLPFGTYFQSI